MNFNNHDSMSNIFEGFKQTRVLSASHSNTHASIRPRPIFSSKNNRNLITLSKISGEQVMSLRSIPERKRTLAGASRSFYIHNKSNADSSAFGANENIELKKSSKSQISIYDPSRPKKARLKGNLFR
mmetsp:Transcript_41191/g.62663  ORF Transcript_41191/g.62663 Transcript_41191/m.62663 type:complete len:127 (+) Transcript_41191:964-1344(+)